jgi:polygalacturonase
MFAQLIADFPVSLDDIMNTPTDSTASSLSRRQWLGRVSLPTLATVGAGLVGVTSVAAAAENSPAPSLDEKNRASRIYNIRDYGAKGDGNTLDTAALQAAIDACHRDGGGMVLVPPGDFVIGTTALKSNMTLHVGSGARLLGSKNKEDFRAGEGVPPGNGNMVMLYAVNAQNLTVEGRGTINGRGATFFNGHGDATAPAAVRSKDPSLSQPNRDRPHMMIFYKCDNLVLRDVYLTESAYHGIRFLQSKQIRCDGVRIYNRVNLNNDGFHFNSCEYVQIANCEIRCQDDACALFGTNKFVNVTNCSFSTRWAIFRFGSGESQNITVSNCVIYETYGAVVKIDVGRGRVENLSFSNIVMKNVTGPISIAFSGRARQRSDGQPVPDSPPGYVRNISFSNIRATVVAEPVQHADMPFPPRTYDGEQLSCITLNGMGNAFLENISFTDVHVTYVGGGSKELAAKRNVPAMAAEYFGVWNQQPFGPPAYGLYARNVKGLTLHNVRFEFEQRDFRPAVVLDHVSDASIVNLSAESDPEAESVLRVIDSKDVLFSAARVLTPSATFLRVEGKENEGILVTGSDLRKAAKPVEFTGEAKPESVKLGS